MKSLPPAIVLALLAACSEPQGTGAPGVLVGHGLLAKSAFAHLPALGKVTDLRPGRVACGEPEALIVAGAEAYALLDPDTGEVLRSVPFAPVWPERDFRGVYPRREIVDADGDGLLEFLALPGFWTGERTALHGADGQRRWVRPIHKPNAAAAETRAADLDGDGDLELLLAFGGGERRTLLVDHRGETLWEAEWAPDPVQSVLLLDVTGDGAREILYLAERWLWVRDAAGELLSRTPIPGGGQGVGLDLLRSHGTPPADAVAVRSVIPGKRERGERIHRVALDGPSFAGELDPRLVEARGPAIEARFPGRPLLYASVAPLMEQVPSTASMATALRFRLRDERRNVVYEEILVSPDGELVRSHGACVFQEAGPQREARILVAFGPRIWTYTLAR